MMESNRLQRRMGLQGKLMLLISILLVVSIATAMVINIKYQQETTRQRLLERAQVMVSLLGRITTDQLRTVQIEELRNTLRLALEQQEVVYAYVFDQQGRIITDGGEREDVLGHKILDDVISRKAVEAKTSLIQFGPGILDVTEPVYLQDEKLGGVRIGFSLGKMRAEIISIRNRNITHGSVFLLIGILLTLVLARTITQPINRLIEGTEAISKGDFDKKIEVHTNDELEILAGSFNRMTEELKRSRDDLVVAKDYTDNIIKSMIEMLLVISLKGEIQTVNAATCALLGYKEEELIGQSIGKIVAQESSFKETWLDDLMSKGHISHVDQTYTAKAGGKIPVSFSASVMWDSHGRVQGILCVAQDIRERKRAEQVLKRQTKELARSNAELEQFASVASHDLQEPLRTVASYIRLLAKRYGNKLDADAQDFIGYAVDGATRMQRLITDLLTFSRVTTKARSFVPVHVAEVAREVISDLQVRIEKTGGRVDIGRLPTIDADVMQMRQLLQNLIGNGLKFHRPEEPPVVNVYGKSLNGQSQQVVKDPSVGEMCQIIVQDNGIGFDEQHCDRIFTVFQRLHTQDEYEGTGVGLAICQKIAARHGGEITARSAPGQGATFTVTLPIRQSTEAANGDANETGQPPRTYG